MLMAVLFSAVGFAQKSFSVQKDIAFNRQTKVQTKWVKQNTIGSAFAVNAKGTSSQSASTGRANARAKAAEVVTPPASGDVEYYTLTATASYGQTQNESVTRQIKIVWDADDEDVVYIQGLSYYMPSSFVMGMFNKTGDQVIFSAGQYMGNPGVDLYFGGYGDGTALTDVVADFDEKESSFTFSDIILDNGDPSEIGYYAYMQNVTIVPLDGEPEIPVEIPSDLEYEKYAYSATDYFDKVDVSGNVNIGIYGEDVYIQGMSTDYPNAWIKGTFENDTTVVFPSGQLLTTERSLYFVAINDNFDPVDQYTLIYDPVTGVFEEGPEAPIINSYKDKIDASVWQFCYGYVFKPITEQAAVPAKSAISSMNFKVTGDDVLEFALATVDVDGEGMVTDKLAYKLWYVTAEGDTLAATFTTSDYPALEEDLDEIPASFTDGAYIQSGALAINMEGHTTWKSLGIQCVYYGGEERNEGEIAWYTPRWPFKVTLPEGLTVTEHDFVGANDRTGAAINRVVGVAFDGDDMYIRGLGSMDETAWVKGTKNATGDYVFPAGQDLGLYYDEDRLFFIGYADSKVTDAILTVDAAGGVYTFTTGIVENADYTDKMYTLLNIASGATISIAESVPEVPTVVEVPEGLQTESWIFSGTDYFDKTSVARSVKVGFDGDDVYVQGISAEVPAAWIKGTLDGDQLTFKSGQFLGGADSLFFIGYTMGSGISDYVMTYDEEAGKFTNDDANSLLGSNAYKDKVQASVYEFYYTTKIAKIMERAATPATPSVTTLRYTNVGNVVEFNIPLIDTNSEGLVDSLVSYKLYYDEGDGEAKEVVFTTDLYTKLTEDMTVVPYGFIDSVDEAGNPSPYDFGPAFVYLNMDDSAWKRIGIQSIYTGGGETNASEIGWYTPTRPTTIELPEGAEVKAYVFSGTDNSGKFQRAVKLAKVDNDVYIQNVATVDDTTWIKGTKSAETDVYTFPKGQFLGVFQNARVRYNIYLMGYNSTLGVMDVKMNYDAEADTYTLTNILVENAGYTDNLYSYNRIQPNSVIAPVEMDRAATPEVPAISTLRYYISGSNNFTSAMLDIPLVDVDGVPLADTLLTYKLYYDEGDSEAKLITFTTDLYQELEADMSEIPYGFIDDNDFFKGLVNLNMDMSTWKRIGIQAIYSGGGETNASEIGWYTPTWPTIAEPADDVETKIYDFFGTDLDDTNCAVGGLKVAMEGDKVYVQSMFENSQYWIVGTKDENNIYTFDLGQYLGNVLGDDGYPYSLFLTGYNTTSREAEALQMSYNEETGVFTTLNLMLSNSDYTDLVDYSAFSIFAPGAQLVPGDGPDAITSVEANAEENAVRFNIAGQRVGKNYKGLIVEKGRKLLQK
jgi:hypothetical protein